MASTVCLSFNRAYVAVYVAVHEPQYRSWFGWPGYGEEWDDREVPRGCRRYSGDP